MTSSLESKGRSTSFSYLSSSPLAVKIEVNLSKRLSRMLSIDRNRKRTLARCGLKTSQPMGTSKVFEFSNASLEYRYVEEVGRRTLYPGVMARLILGSAWALGWRKLVNETDTTSAWRYADPFRG